MNIECLKNDLVVSKGKYGYYITLDGATFDKENNKVFGKCGVRVVLSKNCNFNEIKFEEGATYTKIKADFKITANVKENGELANYPLKITINKIY